MILCCIFMIFRLIDDKIYKEFIGIFQLFFIFFGMRSVFLKTYVNEKVQKVGILKFVEEDSVN